MSRPHRFLRARLAGWFVALGLGLGPAAAHAASDPSAKLGQQVGTWVHLQCPAPDLPHIVAVRSLGDIADWFNPQAFEAAIADELPDGSEVGGRPVVYFDNTNERQIRDRLAGDYGSLFLVELVPAEQRVDASVSGHCLAGVIEEVEMRVVSASPPEPDFDFDFEPEPPVIATSAAPSPTARAPRTPQPKPARTRPRTGKGGYLTAGLIGGTGATLLLASQVQRGQLKRELSGGSLDPEDALDRAEAANQLLYAGYLGVAVGVTVGLGTRIAVKSTAAGAGGMLTLAGRW